MPAEALAAFPPPLNLIEIARLLDEAARMLRTYADQDQDRRGAGQRARSHVSPALVRKLIACRAMRTEQIGLAPTDIGWSLMLEALLARLEGRLVTQQEIVSRTGIPRTTAGRAILTLGEGDFLKRIEDPDKAGRFYIRLTDRALVLMHDFLNEMPEATLHNP